MTENAQKNAQSQTPAIKKWFGGGEKFQMTHYSYAKENDPFYKGHNQTDTVAVPSLDNKKFSRGFLGIQKNGKSLPWKENVGITMQGTGQANDGSHIMYDGTDKNGKAKFKYGVGGAYAPITRPFEQIAVDKSVIPYGSKVYVEAYGKVMSADDTGSAIKGKHIDVFAGAKTYAEICALGTKQYTRVGLVDDNATTGGATAQTTKTAKTKTAENKTEQSGSIAVGSKVKVIGSKYATGQTVPSWVKANTYSVTRIDGKRALLSDIISWVNLSDLQLVGGGTTTKPAETKPAETKPAETKPAENKTEQSGSITVGSKVKVIGSKYATGQTVPSWVKANTYSVTRIDGKRALLSDIISWVNLSDLQLVGGGTTTKPAETKPAENTSNTDTPTKKSGRVTASDGLNLRPTPDTSKSPLACIPSNTWLDVIAQASNGWYKVTYKGMTGYVSNKYLQIGEKPAAGAWQWPTSATRVTSNFGPRASFTCTNGNTTGSYHYGVDISGGGGSSIYASKAGSATKYYDANGYGNWIQIDHKDGTYSRYAHMSSTKISGTQDVSAGQQIGVEGSTGNVTGPHLHFEIRIGGTAKTNAVDPLNYIQ